MIWQCILWQSIIRHHIIPQSILRLGIIPQCIVRQLLGSLDWPYLGACKTKITFRLSRSKALSFTIELIESAPISFPGVSSLLPRHLRTSDLDLLFLSPKLGRTQLTMLTPFLQGKYKHARRAFMQTAVAGQEIYAPYCTLHFKMLRI